MLRAESTFCSTFLKVCIFRGWLVVGVQIKWNGSQDVSLGEAAVFAFKGDIDLFILQHWLYDFNKVVVFNNGVEVNFSLLSYLSSISSIRCRIWVVGTWFPTFEVSFLGDQPLVYNVW